ncbi:MAG: hypothetical protein RL139_1366 [Gemmatimonadota bacterium]|jgi:cytochrome b6-f complex iron-sulfur subunit
MTDCRTTCSLAAAEPADPSRRRFVSAALLASVGAFLVACGDGNIGGVTGPGHSCPAALTDDDDDDDGGGTGAGCGTPPPAGGLVVTLASFAALAADGGIARVDNGTTGPIAAVRVNATTYRAFSMACTHAGTTVNIVGGGFSCPNHGAQFAATGAVTRGPATTALREYTVTLNAAAGTITIV